MKQHKVQTRGRLGVDKVDRSTGRYDSSLFSIPCSSHAGSIREFLFSDRSANAASRSGTEHARPENGWLLSINARVPWLIGCWWKSFYLFFLLAAFNSDVDDCAPGSCVLVEECAREAMHLRVATRICAAMEGYCEVLLQSMVQQRNIMARPWGVSR
jgi:hypothetical protein